MTSATEFIDEPDTIRNEAVDNMTDNKIKKAEYFDANERDGYKLTLDEFGMFTNLDAPKMEFDKYRETRIELSEYKGDDSRTLNLETYLTADELFKFVREVICDDR